MTLILIRYGEMGLKSTRVRSRFEAVFKENIKDFFVRAGLECILSSDWGRIYLRTDKPEQAIVVLRHIFGVVSVSPVIECSSDTEEIKKTAVEYSATALKPGQTFAIRARRTGEHKYTSMELAGIAGEAVLNANRERGVKVRLVSPDVEINIEIRKNRAFIFGDVVPCAGGLPLGTQGKVVVAFSDDYAASSAASWLLMKRGCRAHVLCGRKDDNWIGELGKWDTLLRVHPSDGSAWADAIVVAQKIHADGLVSPESDADKLDKCAVEIAKNAGLPVFYPLIGLDESEIKVIDEKIKA